MSKGLLLISSIAFLFFQYFVFVDLSIIAMPLTKPIISFCGGTNFACVVFDNKKMKCLGQMYAFGASFSTNDRLGDLSDEIGNNIPFMNISANAGVDKVSCGEFHLCVKLDLGDMKCLGKNNVGQLGLGLETNPIGSRTGYIGDNLPVVSIGNELYVLDIALGASHSCGLLTGNKVKCFGNGANGQLGYENANNVGRDVVYMGENLPFVGLGANVEVASIHSGSKASHNCVILSKPVSDAQRIKCWGLNDYWQLGYGDSDNRGFALGQMGDNLPLIDFGTESRVKQLALGGSHTCAFLNNDMLKCIGRGEYGQIASGSMNIYSGTGNSIPYVTIDSGKTVKFVSAGYAHTCIVYDDQLTMKCFGANGNGQLGQGDTKRRGDMPETTIPNIPDIDLGTGSLKIQSIHCGSYQSCVIYENNSVKCFGDNYYGQFAIGSFGYVGYQPGQMGSNLQFAILFSPTKAPTLPTSSPTNHPTNSPSLPTWQPTAQQTNSPTNSAEESSNNPAILYVLAIVLGVPIAVVFLIAFMIICCLKHMSERKKAQVEKSLALPIANQLHVVDVENDFRSVPTAAVIGSNPSSS